jgi:hypothetical protein
MTRSDALALITLLTAGALAALVGAGAVDAWVAYLGALIAVAGAMPAIDERVQGRHRPRRRS